MRKQELAVVVNGIGVINRLKRPERPSPDSRKNLEGADILLAGQLRVERDCRANQFAAMALDPQRVPLSTFFCRPL